MSEDSYPDSGRAAGVVIDADYEALATAYMPDGIIGTPANAYPVYCSGDASRGVRFRAFSPVLYRGVRWEANADVTKSADPNPAAQARLDLACLEMDHDNNNRVRARIITGVAGNSSGPTPATDAIGGTGVVQLPLAWIEVPPGAVTLDDARVRRQCWWVAPDGRLVSSTTSKRPAPLPGRLLTEYETGNLYQGDGAAYRLVAGDSGVLAVTVGTTAVSGATEGPNWSNLSSGYGAKIRNKNGSVSMSLEVSRVAGGTLAAGSDVVVAKVPAGFEPPATWGASGKPIHFWCSSASGVIGQARVRTDGKIELRDYPFAIPVGSNLVFISPSWSV
jgi:hypothetical protein